MRKRILSGVFASFVCGAVAMAAAQDPQTQQSGAAAAKGMTVTGCIQRAETPATGATGTSGTSAADQAKFVLKNVSASSASSASSSTAGTAGTAGTSSSTGATASEYRLVGTDAKLSPHVGHKVEITGTAAKPASAAQSSASSAAASPELKVDNVKMISTTCP
jgi:hypothetical protein